MRTLRHEVAILVLSAILCVSGAVLGQSEVQKIVIATITDDIFQVLDVDRTGCAFAYLVDKSGPAILRASRNGLVERFALAVPLVFPPDCGRVAQALDDGRLLLLTRPNPNEIIFGELRFPR